MGISITCYGGVGQIGGNKVLLEDGATGGRVFLDFGTSYGDRERYFEEFLNPRPRAGLLDLIELGMVPPFRGLYRPDLLDLPDTQEQIQAFPDLAREGKPPIDAVLLSHAHLDHSGYISFLRPDIPVVSTAMTAALAKAIQDTASGGSDLEREVAYFTEKERKRDKALEDHFYLEGKRGSSYQLRPFLIVGAPPAGEGWPLFWSKSRAKTKALTGNVPQPLGQGALPFPVQCLPVDHSIFGAAAFAMETSAGWVGYTGDLRFAGKRGGETLKALETFQRLRLKVLIGEGTRLGDKEDTKGTEEEVYQRSLAAVRGAKGLVVADFGPRNIERLEVFHRISKETGRPLVILDKDAYLLDAMRLVDPSVPDLKGTDILIYHDRGEDSREWQAILWERYADKYVSPSWFKQRGHDCLLCFSFLDLKHLIDIAPSGGAYIYSTSEAHNEEQQLDFKRLKNWTDHFALKFVGDPETEPGYHASGHASESELVRFVREVAPRSFVPLHTQKPERYLELLSGLDVRLPQYGVPLRFD